MVDDTIESGESQKVEQLAEDEHVNSESTVLNDDTDTTEVDIILGDISDRTQSRPSYGIPAPSINLTPLDEAAGNDRLSPWLSRLCTLLVARTLTTPASAVSS